MAGVSLHDIRKRFGSTDILRGVSLEVSDGEFVTLVGPSGCGKSTLLKIIAGLEPQDSGEVRIGAQCVDARPPKERDVAMVFQSYALYPYLNVFDNLALPLIMRRLDAWQRLPLLGRYWPGGRAIREGIDRDVAEVAHALEIGHLLQRRPAQLSGGQRQRVALGRAMVRHPQVFLMDEPLSNLDAKLRVQTRTEIAELHRRLGATFLFVTHDQAEAMTMSDRVAVMMDGRLLQVAPPQRVYDDPDDLQVAEFIGSPRINVLPARLHGDGGLELPGACLPASPGLGTAGPVTVGLRPESLHLANGERSGVLRGTVRLLEHLGGFAYVHAAVAGVPASVVVRAEPQDAARLSLGAPVALKPLADRALVFGADGRRLRPPRDPHDTPGC
jgi:multiple sugar transport system ATP-binding protein